MINVRDTLKIENNQLVIGGVKCEELAKEYNTPLYVMDKAHVVNMAKTYKNAMDKYYGFGQVSYASKAFCCKEIYRIINSCGIGIDVVSDGELYTALSVDFPSNKIIFHGNNKTPSELIYALDSKVEYIVIDSINEIELLDSICATKNIIQKVLIRVNPGVEAHTHHYIQTARIDSKFGFSLSDGTAEDAIKKILSTEYLKLDGLHCHIGSQIFDDKAFILAIDKMTDYYKYLKETLNLELNVFNLGGGFGIYYSGDDKKLNYNDYDLLIKSLCNKLNLDVKTKNIKKPYFIIEPGRSIVGEAGITLYTVGNIKEIKDVKNYISIDGGMFENPRFALYQARYTVIPTSNFDRKFNVKYSIAGKCCESGDLIAEDCMLPKMKVGDTLCVLSTGAYNYSMSSNYNRNTIPAVVFVDNGKSYLAVKRQTFKDLTRNDI